MKKKIDDYQNEFKPILKIFQKASNDQMKEMALNPEKGD
jgi:hypothetical protein